eukprot:m51a1_g9701 hypothetical protein (109) ;mRNA; r:1385717-1386306
MFIGEDMAEGRVQFGHAGFGDRVRRFPFASRSSAENVAMNEGFGDAARVAVDGWVDSPGHRRNLLCRCSHCGVGVHRRNLLCRCSHCGVGVHRSSRGAWFLTQLFALP